MGIAGLGKMGKLHYKNSIKNKNINLLAVADLKKSNLKIADKNNVKKYTDYKDMIEKEDLDAVIISLPNFIKKESALYAMENDLSIFMDKPLARNLHEAKEIVKRVKKSSTQFTVGTNYRYYKSIQKIKKIIDEGNIGQPVLATSDLIMDGPFSHPLVPAQVAEWWFSKELSGGGAILDLGYHLLDLLTWFFGELNVEYSAIDNRYNLDIEDAATILLKSNSGTRCNVNVGWYSKMLFPNFNFRVNVHGTVGKTSTDEFAPRNMYINAVKEGIKNGLRRITFQRLEYLSYTYYYASFYNILEDYIDSLQKGIQSPISIDEQLLVMKTLDRVYNMAGE